MPTGQRRLVWPPATPAPVPQSVDAGRPEASLPVALQNVRDAADRAALGTGHDRAVVPGRRRAHADVCVW